LAVAARCYLPLSLLLPPQRQARQAALLLALHYPQVRRVAPRHLCPAPPLRHLRPALPLSYPASSAHLRVPPLGHSRLPPLVSYHQRRAFPSQERPLQRQHYYRQRVRNSRLSSDWWRGIPGIQMLSYANLAMTCLRVYPRHLRQSPMCLSVPITSLGQGIVSISCCGEVCRRAIRLKSTVMAL